MASVTLENLFKNYGDAKRPNVALKGIDLEIRDREFMVLVGPSGCGKSTTLRVIAGLEDLTSGRVIIDGQEMNHVLPRDRDIAMVFQNYALYPHMSVYENMAFALKMRRFPADEIRSRVESAAKALDITSYLHRKPHTLSGGQMQRVALGRAIVRSPRVFLFDEPLSNLDAKARVSMRTEIVKLHDRLQATMIYVTHDQVEAMTMGDRICVMNEGEIVQVDEPLNIYNKPVNMFVAAFIGSPQINFIKGRIVSEEGRSCFIEQNDDADALRFDIGEQLSLRMEAHRGKTLVLGVRPEDIYDQRRCTATQPTSQQFARVEISEPMGPETYLYLNTGAHPLIARVRSNDRYQTNEQLQFRMDLAKLHFFDAESGLAL